MVALVIVALGMMAVNTQLNRYAVPRPYIEEKTLASWIATNKLTELSVAPTWPTLGDYDEDVEFAGQQWRCEIVVSRDAGTEPAPRRRLGAPAWPIPSASCTKSPRSSSPLPRPDFCRRSGRRRRAAAAAAGERG